MFRMDQASKLVRFLAQDDKATWGPTAEGGVVVQHADERTETFTKQHLVEAAKNYAYEISVMK
jgi:hypothetical protein